MLDLISADICTAGFQAGTYWADDVFRGPRKLASCLLSPDHSAT